MYSSKARIVANHNNNNIAEVYATQTPQQIIYTIISLTSVHYVILSRAEESIKINLINKENHIDASVAFILFTSLSMYSSKARIVANHNNNNIAEVYATLTPQPKTSTILLTTVHYVILSVESGANEIEESILIQLY